MCCSDDEDAGAEPSSPWTRDLNALDLNNRGGLPRASKVPLFCRVLRGADSLDMRKVSLKVCLLFGRYIIQEHICSLHAEHLHQDHKNMCRREDAAASHTKHRVYS